MTARPPIWILVVAGLGLLVLLGASIALARPVHLVVRVVDTAGPMPEWDAGRAERDSDRPEAPSIGVSAVGLVGGLDVLSIHRPGFQLSCGVGNHGWFQRSRFGDSWGLEHVYATPTAMEYLLSPHSTEYWFDPPSLTVRRGEAVTFRATRYPPDTRVRLCVYANGQLLPPGDWGFQMFGRGSAPKFGDRFVPDEHGKLPLPIDNTSDFLGWVVAAGFRSQLTNGAGLQFDGMQFTREVYLEPGYRASLLVVDSRGRSLPAPVQVHFDGTTFVSRTGLSRIESPNARPEVRIEIPGHRIIGGDAASDGTLPPGRAGYRVEVEPVYVMRPPR